jgi:hypothetical protein
LKDLGGRRLLLQRFLQFKGELGDFLFQIGIGWLESFGVRGAVLLAALAAWPFDASFSSRAVSRAASYWPIPQAGTAPFRFGDDSRFRAAVLASTMRGHERAPVINPTGRAKCARFCREG